MRISETNNNLIFSARNVFLSPEKFATIFNRNIKGFNHVAAPWNLRTVKYGYSWIGTSDINTCSVMVLNNGKGLVQHYMPSRENFDSINAIRGLTEKFMAENPIKSILLIGSKSSDTPVIDLEGVRSSVPDSKHFLLKPLYDEKSSKMFNLLREMVADFRPTILEGHRLPNTRSHIVQDVKNDTNYILTYIDTRKKCYVSTSSDLNMAFESVEVSPNDSVEFIV